VQNLATGYLFWCQLTDFSLSSSTNRLLDEGSCWLRGGITWPHYWSHKYITTFGYKHINPHKLPPPQTAPLSSAIFAWLMDMQHPSESYTFKCLSINSMGWTPSKVPLPVANIWFLWPTGTHISNQLISRQAFCRAHGQSRQTERQAHTHIEHASPSVAIASIYLNTWCGRLKQQQKTITLSTVPNKCPVVQTQKLNTMSKRKRTEISATIILLYMLIGII